MPSPNGEAAITFALETGNALLKFLSANDVGKTLSHQGGFYLPKEPGVWEMFTRYAPVKGRKDKELVSILWQIEEYKTNSAITWYGRETRSEYRLTRLGGKKFPYITHDSIGDLLVLIPFDHLHFRAFLLDLEDDVEELLAALGVQMNESWGVFRGGAPKLETEEECVERAFGEFVQHLKSFPTGAVFSQTTRAVIDRCIRGSGDMDSDAALSRWLESEYRLFRMAERILCTNEIQRLFRDIEDFLGTASTIMNRRKARAGRSLENHVEALLMQKGIPHAMRTDVIEGRPDIVIPGVQEYLDPAFPLEKLFVVGVKTTCKDRWRQVLNEGRRVPHKHILTTQPGISINQLREMHSARVSLIVPRSLIPQYPKAAPIELFNVEQFVSQVKRVLAS